MMTLLAVTLMFSAMLIYFGFVLGARYESRRIHRVMIAAWEKKNTP